MRKAILFFVAFIPAVVGYAELGYCPLVKEYDLAEEKCLATMIYGEARGESLQGQVAVAWTSKNRAGKARNKTVCDIVLAPKQYSIFNNNPALYAAATNPHIEPTQHNIIDEQSWAVAVEVAQDILRNRVQDPTNGATHYVAYKSLKRIPNWTKVFSRLTVIGNHTFFKEPDKKFQTCQNRSSCKFA